MTKTGPERGALRGPVPILLTLGLALGAGLGAGCSQAPAPEPAVLEAPAEVAAEAPATPAEPAAAPVAPEAAAPAPAPPAEEPAAAAEETDATVIVIERRDREREAKPRTLYEASVAAREQRAKASPSTVSITDENLHEYQGQGLTFAEAAEGEGSDDGSAEGGEDGASAADAPGPDPERGEAYWRTRVHDLRLALRQAVDELDGLEERAASLRRSFYAEDDPYVRDAEIKPAWDRALDRIAGTRRALTRMRDELAATLEEGRRAGALPGWLREGIELEPLPEELPPPGEGTGAHEPGEPSVIEIGEPPP